MIDLVVLVFAYLIGSVPTGYLLGSRAGIDIRKAGSGNIGATNVARVLGKREGILTLLADAGKGYVAVWIAAHLQPAESLTALAGIAAFLGHLYPIFLKFRGGKGVSTAVGALLALAPLAVPILIAVFGATIAISRKTSLASMVAAAAAPVTLWLLSYPHAVVGSGAFFALMIIFRHRANIQRLLTGTEPSFGTSSQ